MLIDMHDDVFAKLSVKDKLLMLDMMANTDCDYTAAIMAFITWEAFKVPDHLRVFEDDTTCPRGIKVGYNSETFSVPTTVTWLARFPATPYADFDQ